MAHINLLPWREELRQRRKMEFFVVLGASVLSALFIMLTIHMTMSHKIYHQKQRNAFLQEEVRQLNNKIGEINRLKQKKDALMARMVIIQELQTNRSQVVHIFDDIINILPKGVHLHEVARKSDDVIVSGFAQSNTNISSLMRNMANSDWFNSPILNKIKTKDVDGQYISQFSLQSRVIHTLHAVGEAK